MKHEWKPIISSTFCYDSHRCHDFYDRWLMRGGQLSRDCVYWRRAQDMQDLRPFNDRVKWVRMEGELRLRRMRMVKVSEPKTARIIELRKRT